MGRDSLGDEPFWPNDDGIEEKFSNRTERAKFRVDKGAAKPDSALADRAAAAALLRYLDQLPEVRRQPPELLHGLQVRRVNLLWKAGRIGSRDITIAQQSMNTRALPETHPLYERFLCG